MDAATSTPVVATVSQQQDASRLDAASTVASGGGFSEKGPWVSFYGTAAQMGDLAKVANTFRVINIDADPQTDGQGNFTNAQLATLRANGKNKVLSYLNLGSCERFRSYWSVAPAPLVACAKSTQLGAYDGYPDEVWMDLGDPAYQALILEHVAPRLAARGIDGFYLDNLELVEHAFNAKNGPCSARCKQGGLDLVRKLRERFPALLIVMQNATSDVTRLGTTGGRAFPSLLDGIAHEEVYAPTVDVDAESELLAWQSMNLRGHGGKPFWIAVEDYAGSCAAKDKARAALDRSSARGFAGYVSDESGGQRVVCFWN